MIPEAREVYLSRKDRKVLEACCRSPMTLQRDLKRARIVLLAADGRSTRSIAKEVGVQPRIVSLWRHRYADHGLEGLQDKPRPGKQPIYTKATDKRILQLLDKPAPQGFARWTGPLLAEALGDVDVQYVWRFLRSHKIDLAARKSWCESNDPNFTAKAADVVGLYVAPPAKAIVLCVDEKPSIQALERAQGYLKLPNGRALTGQSHDCKRHGTTTLFAALEVATGKIIASRSKRRRRVEFLDFMNSFTAAFPGRKLHVILDNLNPRGSPRTTPSAPRAQSPSPPAARCARAASGRGSVGQSARPPRRCPRWRRYRPVAAWPPADAGRRTRTAADSNSSRNSRGRSAPPDARAAGRRWRRDRG